MLRRDRVLEIAEVSFRVLGLVVLIAFALYGAVEFYAHFLRWLLVHA